MSRFFKIILVTFALVFSVCIMDSCKSRGPYNPYSKMRVKPNKRQLDADKIVIKKGNRAYKRQMGKNRRSLFGIRKPPKSL